MPSCHCGKTLRKVYKEDNLYECPICKCVYRLVIVCKSKECAEKERESEMKSLKLVLAEKRKGKKRGRRKR